MNALNPEGPSGIGDREVVGAVSKSSKVEASDDLRFSKRCYRSWDDCRCINQGDCGTGYELGSGDRNTG